MIAEGKVKHVVLYTFDATEEFLSIARDIGVSGVVLKSATGDVLATAIERVMAGERVGLDDVVRATRSRTSKDLSPREQEVLALLALGRTNAEIGEQLFLSVDTVKTYVRRVFAKLGVNNRTQAAMHAAERSLTPRHGAWPSRDAHRPTRVGWKRAATGPGLGLAREFGCGIDDGTRSTHGERERRQAVRSQGARGARTRGGRHRSDAGDQRARDERVRARVATAGAADRAQQSRTKRRSRSSVAARAVASPTSTPGRRPRLTAYPGAGSASCARSPTTSTSSASGAAWRSPSVAASAESERRHSARA